MRDLTLKKNGYLKLFIVLVAFTFILISCGGGGSSDVGIDGGSSDAGNGEGDSTNLGDNTDNGTEIVILTDTGQITSYTETFGEDSDYSINPPVYTKLDETGNDFDDNAIEWTMVKDEVTGLIWEVKSDDGGIHDKNNTYGKYDAINIFIAQLNNDNFGGYSDWRLPTIKELNTLVNSDNFNPAIDVFYFPNTMRSIYWSFTDSNTKHLTVDFADGSLQVFEDPAYVRAVRGDQGKINLIDNNDYTVTDQATGLMWQQLIELNNNGSASRTWEESLEYCEKLELADFNDWRLPDRNELLSLADYEVNYNLNEAFFPDGLGYHCWSSTTYAPDTKEAWMITFIGHGIIRQYDKILRNNVRCVRYGQ